VLSEFCDTTIGGDCAATLRCIEYFSGFAENVVQQWALQKYIVFPACNKWCVDFSVTTMPHTGSVRAGGDTDERSSKVE
jgi:hypothetical protein